MPLTGLSAFVSLISITVGLLVLGRYILKGVLPA